MNAQARPSMAHGNEEILRAKADEINKKRAQRKREQTKKEREAEEQTKKEREAKEQAKKEPKTCKQGKIKSMVDGIEFDNLSAAMAHIDPKLWGKRNDYRDSCWTKINRKLKKDGVCEFQGHIYKLI